MLVHKPLRRPVNIKTRKMMSPNRSPAAMKQAMATMITVRLRLIVASGVAPGSIGVSINASSGVIGFVCEACKREKLNVYRLGSLDCVHVLIVTQK